MHSVQTSAKETLLEHLTMLHPIFYYFKSFYYSSCGVRNWNVIICPVRQFNVRSLGAPRFVGEARGRSY